MKKKTPHVRNVKGKAVPAGKKAPPIDLLKNLKDLLKIMYQKKYAKTHEGANEMKQDQKKLNKLVEKLPKTKKTEKIKKEAKKIDFWDDYERKQQLLDMLSMVLSLMMFYIEFRLTKKATGA
jgi:hypothetical protein